MKTLNISHSYTEAIKAIKQVILQSRYRAAMLANREMKNMRLFYEAWQTFFPNRQLSTDDLQTSENIDVRTISLNRPLPMVEIRQLSTGEFGANQLLNHFVFSHNKRNSLKNN